MRILGIDVGGQNIKAVEIESTFGRFELREYYERKLHEGDDPFEAAAELINGLPKAPDRIAVSLRTQRTTFRNLTLPTRDKKAIQSGVHFELDDELPYPIEDSAFDYCQTSQIGNQTQVHVASTLKRHLEIAIAEFKSTGIDPDLVTTEAWALHCLMAKVISASADAAAETPALVLNLGHSRTVLYLHHNNQPVLAREIPFGGKDLTAAICAKYGITPEQGEAAKLDSGFILPPSQREQASPEQQAFSETLLQPVGELLKEIKQTGLICKTITQKNPSSIYICGGTALLPGLARLIEEETLTPVKQLQSLSSLAPGDLKYSEHTDVHMALGAGLALSLVGPAKTNGINFRKGEFAKTSKVREINLTALRRPLMAMGAILFCFVASLVTQRIYYKSKLSTVDSQLESSIKSFFNTSSASVVRGYVGDRAKLKREVTNQLNRQKQIAKLLAPNPTSPLNYLRALSGHIGRDVVVDTMNFQVGAAASTFAASPSDATVSMSFLFENPQVGERLASLVERKISGVQRSKMEDVPSADGKSKKYKLTFSGKPAEGSYGP